MVCGGAPSTAELNTSCRVECLHPPLHQKDREEDIKTQRESDEVDEKQSVGEEELEDCSKHSVGLSDALIWFI